MVHGFFVWPGGKSEGHKVYGTLSDRRRGEGPAGSKREQILAAWGLVWGDTQIPEFW